MLLIGLVSVISLMMVVTIINVSLAAKAVLPEAHQENNGSAEKDFAGSAATFPFTYSLMVAQLINEVKQADVYTYTAGLTGESPVTIGGQAVTLNTRNTYAQPEIEQTTQYVYEFTQAKKLYVSHHGWSGYDEEEEKTHQAET